MLLGEPGAGKTGAMILLLLAALKHRRNVPEAQRGGALSLEADEGGGRFTGEVQIVLTQYALKGQSSRELVQVGMFLRGEQPSISRSPAVEGQRELVWTGTGWGAAHALDGVVTKAVP